MRLKGSAELIETDSVVFVSISGATSNVSASKSHVFADNSNRNFPTDYCDATLD